MVARVTAEEVKEIVNTSIADDVILTNHIDTANVYVNDHLTDLGHSSAMLKKIELYLAAHFVALTDGGPLTRSKLGDADESYANIYGEGLKATPFGQAAMSLDNTGTLTKLATTALKADFRVV